MGMATAITPAADSSSRFRLFNRLIVGLAIISSIRLRRFEPTPGEEAIPTFHVELAHIQDARSVCVRISHNQLLSNSLIDHLSRPVLLLRYVSRLDVLPESPRHRMPP